MEIIKNTLTPELFIGLYSSEGRAVSPELISTKEAVGFYKRMGFEERHCDRDGPGMFKMMGN